MIKKQPKVLLFTAVFIALSIISISSSGQNTVTLEIAQIQTQLDSIKSKEGLLRDKLETLKLEQVRFKLKEKGLPKVNEGEEIVFHSAMALVFDNSHKQAKWVAHIITSDVASGNISRTNDFRPDSTIKTGSAVEADYFLKEQKPDGTFKYDGFGFDRGHLAPSADFRWSATALSESYFYSNMSPQVADFNRISWARLEDLLRDYINRNPNSELFVVTGPLLNDSLPRIERGVNKVSIPKYYYKVAVDFENSRAIAFLMPNKFCEKPTENYAVPIDSIETLTGIDFFYSLPVDVQAKFESQKDPIAWLSKGEQSDAMPLDSRMLPKKHFNTLEAKLFVNKPERVSICGTVVSSKLSGKNNVFLNLDKSFPNQVFTVTIFSNKLSNFSYQPHELLMSKEICVTGKITEYNGIPSMIIDNEKAITFLEN
jgi:endonuclease G